MNYYATINIKLTGGNREEAKKDLVRIKKLLENDNENVGVRTIYLTEQDKLKTESFE